MHEAYRIKLPPGENFSKMIFLKFFENQNRVNVDVFDHLKSC